MSREGGERCRAIFKSEIREIELGKTIAIKRLWRLLKKIRMRESSLQMLLCNMARKARTSAFIKGQAFVFHHPIIDQGIAGACVESHKFAVPSNESHIADTADIHKGTRPQWGQGGMVNGNQGCALPASGNVSGAHIIDDRNARGLGQGRTIAQLNGETKLGLMQNRLTVKADYIYF